MVDLANITRLKGLTRQAFSEGAMLNNLNFSNSIDILYERPMFGKINLKGNAIVLSEVNLRQLRTPLAEKTFFAVDFVADAFEALRSYYGKAFKRKKLKQKSIMKQIKPYKAWESANFAYHEHILTLYKGFFEVFIKTTKQEKQIISFESFLRVYGQYLENFLDVMPMTKTGFVLSKYTSIHSSGLAIDVFPANNVEMQKNFSTFFADPNFNFFARACKKFGFRIDKHAPYRIIADIYSPNMKKWMKPYALTPEKFLREYYYEAYKYDVSSLAIYLKDFYNSYISAWPYVNETQGFAKSIGKKGVYKDLKTKNCLVFRKPINPLEYQKKYGPSTLWMLRTYTIIRGTEARADWLPADYQTQIQRSMELSKIFDYNKAISYINKQVRNEQINILNGELGKSLMFAKPNKNDTTAALNKEFLDIELAKNPPQGAKIDLGSLGSIFNSHVVGWKKEPVSEYTTASVYKTFKHCKGCKPGELFSNAKMLNDTVTQFVNSDPATPTTTPPSDAFTVPLAGALGGGKSTSDMSSGY
jgi:hypothetical protein